MDLTLVLFTVTGNQNGSCEANTKVASMKSEYNCFNDNARAQFKNI